MAFILRNLSSFIFGGEPLAPQQPTGAGRTQSLFPTNVPEASQQPPITRNPMAITVRPGLIPAGFEANHESPWNNFSRDAERQSEQPPPYHSRDHDIPIPEPDVDLGILPAGMEFVERRCCLLFMHHASLPEKRFAEQVTREKTRIIQKSEACNLKTQHCLQGSDLTQRAREIVQLRWEEQGISKEGTWFCGPSTDPSGFWKHQEIRKEDGPKEVRRRDMSRPYFQFEDEVAAERDHIEFLTYPPRLPDDLITSIPLRLASRDDLYSTADYNVRNQWVREGLWDARWGEVPGMFWKHEHDIRTCFREESIPLDHIPQYHLDISDSLQRQESFQGRRFGFLGFLPKTIELQLLSAEQRLSPPPEWTDEMLRALNPTHLFSPGRWPSVEGNNAEPLSARPEDGNSQGTSSDALSHVSHRTQPLSVHGRPGEHVLAGSCEQRVPPDEELAPSETSSGSMYGDENSEDFLKAFSRQIMDVQNLAQQALDAQKQLAAQFSAVRGSHRRRERSREVFAEGSHQRRVLGPLPSTQRVSKKAKGEMVPGRTGLLGLRASPASSAATTVIFAPARPPFPEDHHSAESAGSQISTGSFIVREDSPEDEDFVICEDSPQDGDFIFQEDIPQDGDFVIREDTPQDEEDLPMEEPRVELSPRARTRQRRRESTERRALQPLRRSKRNTQTR